MKIRHSVFETNSSSTHAIVIKGIPSIKDLQEVSFGEYGWECGSFSGTQSKADYLYTYFLNYKEGSLDLFKQTLEDYVGHSIEFQEKNGSDSWNESGYIDHGDDYDFEITRENILDIVFGDGYIVTCNDNDDDESLGVDGEEKYFYKGN